MARGRRSATPRARMPSRLRTRRCSSGWRGRSSCSWAGEELPFRGGAQGLEEGSSGRGVGLGRPVGIVFVIKVEGIARLLEHRLHVHAPQPGLTEHAPETGMYFLLVFDIVPVPEAAGRNDEDDGVEGAGQLQEFVPAGGQDGGIVLVDASDLLDIPGQADALEEPAEELVLLERVRGANPQGAVLLS